MKFRSSRNWLFGAASAALAIGLAGPASAQEANGEPIASAEDIVVLGQIQYRNRVDGAAPVLEYGSDYFQRFEPLTVGDALKRVPSVAFLSDVLESDGVRLRGLDPAYTQILINGEQVPGSGADSGAFGNGADGSFFVDRIPAELIERVEIVRSPSANRSGDAVAGAVNIVLRDSLSLDGGYVRAGALYFDNDAHWGQVLGGVWGGELLGGRMLVGLNMQDRHNPKDKFSARYDEPGGILQTIEDQTDVRDGTDYSGNFSYEVDAFGGELQLDGFYVRTDRTADEDSIEYVNLTTATGGTNVNPASFDAIRVDPSLFTLNSNDVDTEQTSYSLSGRYTFPMLGGETSVRLGHARFETDEPEFETEVEYLRGSEFIPIPAANRIFPEADRITHDLVSYRVDDAENSIRLSHEREAGLGQLSFGIDYQTKERDIFAGEGRFRVSLSNGTLLPTANLADYIATPGVPAYVAPAITANPGGDNTIERTRLDPYVMIEGESGPFVWEAGLRYETTEIEITDRTLGGATSDNSYEFLLPSLHLRWNLSEEDRLFASLARTVRNPSFNFLSPAVLEAELGDNDFVGNPGLSAETAWGIDVGYERRLGRTGVAGINFFYRDVTDVIEIFNTGVVGSEGGAARVFSTRNTGDGTVWGVEIDYSAPLTAIGLENTGVFLNYSWLDSEIDDEFGSRRFNSQAESILNVGFIHDMPSLGASFGASYRNQGEAFSRVVGEEVTTEYGADLEMFVEKRFGESFTLRLTGSNLLDSSKDEIFDKFADHIDQAARSYDEYELETESAGPVFQLIGRYAF